MTDHDTGVIPKARGFCVCHRTTTDPAYLPAPGAAWHYLCDKPVLPPAQHEPDPAKRVPSGQRQQDRVPWPAQPIPSPVMCATCFGIDWTRPHECQGGSCFCFCRVPEYEPDDGEAQRIAEVYADARAELDRGL